MLSVNLPPVYEVTVHYGRIVVEVASYHEQAKAWARLATEMRRLQLQRADDVRAREAFVMVQAKPVVAYFED